MGAEMVAVESVVASAVARAEAWAEARAEAREVSCQQQSLKCQHGYAYSNTKYRACRATRTSQLLDSA
jgi:hypothetical protein